MNRSNLETFLFGLVILALLLVFLFDDAADRKEFAELHEQLNAVATQSEQNASHFRGIEPTPSGMKG